MRLRTTILTTVAFATAALLSAAAASGIAVLVENRSHQMVRLALEAAGQGWAQVETDGLQVILTGTAPDEPARFRALSVVGSLVERDRIIDTTDVKGSASVQAPEFSLEILRNGDGIQLIGLIPKASKSSKLIKELQDLAEGGQVTDLLETADYPMPPGWAQAQSFAYETLRTLPRAKISVSSGHVSIEAITESVKEKARVETSLARRRPADMKLDFDISAPRPVITPFTLRFIIDDEGARFDACSADTTRARDRIIAAARGAGAEGAQGCTIGMGVPSPQWGAAVEMALGALKEMGKGTLTFSDADIALSADPSVAQQDFDRVVGELESNLPEVFSLKSELRKAEVATTAAVEFLAEKTENGRVVLRGRVGTAGQRDIVENFARAQFGHEAVYGATRSAENLPSGWSLRALAGLEALHELHQGSLTVTPAKIILRGVSASPEASDAAARILAERLGEGADIELSITYDKRLDPVLALPDGPECVARLNTVLAGSKITFEPGSSTIAVAGGEALDRLAGAMKDCDAFGMEIGGHTDSQGSDEMNLRLSQDRASAVLRALMDRRISVRNLSAKGYGETQPIEANDTEEGREANRRIAFVLLDATPQDEGAADASSTEVTATEPVAATQATNADTARGAEVTVETPAKDTPRPKPRPEGLGQ
ncbi:OmpA family protein [Thioclava sp. A2]|uniref:OmpA family protein n=1 Tax=Thioclava sp. FCG-A2 TaxID=3080562 RepID=UPI002955A63E|nr:OmpA family protein [Thioclava sp. A2]MDV7272002.1 OmpA family protein [Thioclava sp. A2]